MSGNILQVAGDEDTGDFTPPVVESANFSRLAGAVLSRLRKLPGLTGTASDVLDELGDPLVVCGNDLQQRVPETGIAGHAITLRYVPAEQAPSMPNDQRAASRLAHHVAFAQCSAGDVLVIDAGGIEGISTFGGMASLAALEAGLSGIVVDGAIRDVDTIRMLGLPAWSRGITPRTGKLRLQAVSINTEICCAGQPVAPGDLVLADQTGVCFVPRELAERVSRDIIVVAERERAHLHRLGFYPDDDRGSRHGRPSFGSSE